MDDPSDTHLIRYVLLLFALEFFLRGITGMVTDKGIAAALWFAGATLVGVGGIVVYRRLGARGAEPAAWRTD